MSVHSSVLSLIGNTPIVEAQHLDTGPCRLFLKLENHNPGGSIKDRIGVSMIEAAEQRGDLKPGATLVEGTAGNTGLGLALVARQKGYKLILVVPDKMSREKIFNVKAMGAQVVLTRSDVAKGHPEYYQDLAKTIADETPGAFFVNQFGNPDNPAAHEFGTGPEILRQMAEVGGIDAMVFGCGSSGTMTGLSRCFAEQSPYTELVLADPVGSILEEYINRGTLSDKSASWMVEGIGEDFLPSISDFTRVKKAYAISDAESFHAARHLLEAEGILGGSSTGTLLAAALKYCREQTEPKNVLTLVCDTGNQRMKLYDISQLPVMDGDRIVGMVDESDVLLHVYGDESRFREPVSSAMVKKLDGLDVKAPIEALLPVFDRGQVAIIMDGNDFLGLITRIDLLNYLRRRVQ